VSGKLCVVRINRRKPQTDRQTEKTYHHVVADKKIFFVVVEPALALPESQTQALICRFSEVSKLLLFFL
jgi:hypothetical protein